MTAYVPRRAKFEGVGYTYLTLPAAKIRPGDGLIIEFGHRVASDYGIQYHDHSYRRLVTVIKVERDEEFGETNVTYRKRPWFPLNRSIMITDFFEYPTLEKGYAVIVADTKEPVER